MRSCISECIRIFLLLLVTRSVAVLSQHDRHVPAEVFESLEELSRIVDISYCVGNTGISKPFECFGRCRDFKGFKLITTWNTGPLLSDSCGYIAISHEPFEKRVLVVFRGTYSIANTIADLSTGSAEYVPYPEGGGHDLCDDETLSSDLGDVSSQSTLQLSEEVLENNCKNCTIHSGFFTSWLNTRCTIIPYVESALLDYPDYKLQLVGHSLGGAVATIAALEFQARGYNPYVTTFGEPKIGNEALVRRIDAQFELNNTAVESSRFWRVTHVDDPVPLLPLREWGYRTHGGEIYISKPSLPPGRADLWECEGDSDPDCIATASLEDARTHESDARSSDDGSGWAVSSRYKLRQLFFAHRDYFWRLGLCIPGGDPWD